MNKQLFFPVLGLAVICLAFFSGCQGGGSGATATSANGFQYTHHIQNEGVKPQPGDQVYFHFQVFLDDSLLQASYTNPQLPNFQLPTPEEVEKQPDPVVDVLPLMSVGDSITVVQPLDSLPQRPPGFEKYTDLVYTVTLYDIKSAEEYQIIAEAEQKKSHERVAAIKTLSDQVLADYNAGKLTDELTETATGLKYIIHEEGTGAVPVAGDPVDVHYYGTLTDGTMFDNSYAKGSPISFAVGQGQVIPGWDEGLTTIKQGSKATFFIPFELAYGERGNPPVIPAKAELVFYVELLEPNTQ